jgi:uncharacterized surface protein with fasciclin (FAS1) repeats
MKTFKNTLSLCLVAGLFLMGCDSNDVSEEIPTPEPENTIVDVAVAGGFDTLVAAVQAAGLVETLSGSGPFTVFAPTDAAFAKLPAGTVESLLEPANKDLLVSILTYHVVQGRVTSEQVVGLSKAPTVQGQDIAIAFSNGTVMINDASVTAVDIVASNGIIHVIDSVLLPPSN